jgi:protein-disulfide isomerase
MIVLGLVILREYRGWEDTDAVSAEVPVTVDHERMSSTGHRLGPEAAPVTVVEFADLDCPACRLFYDHWEEIRRRYGESVALVYRHLPLTSLHPRAYLGALAAECAAEQGRFEEFYNAVYTRAETNGPESWEDIAPAAGVADAEDLRNCIATERHRSAVERDIAEIRAAGVRGTPALIIGGQVHVGALSVDELTKRLEAVGLEPTDRPDP